MLEILPDTAAFEDGHLHVGGCDAVALAGTHGTPLVVIDRATVEARAAAFSSVLPPGQIFYAAKAFCCVAICELFAELGLGIDVCSGGELKTALSARFPPDRILFHGNNKSIEELEAARDAGIGRVVVDSLDEMDRIAKVGLATKLLIRVTPGVEAHTHEFVQTGQEDSKFGFGLHDEMAFEAVERALAVEGCELVGLHSHIGSQIFDMAAFTLAARRVAAFAAQVKERLGCEVEELNLGGGLGIAHTRDELTPDPAEAVRQIQEAAVEEFERAGLAVPRILIEPGRALVGASGLTLYEVGTVKSIPGVRTYVSVDGGMSDNVRPALYGARYEAFLANRTDDPPGPLVTLSGKHCESGDVLIRDVHLPEDVAPGDIVCIPATGAYTYSMASNYNRVGRPQIILVQRGHATTIVARESEEALLSHDLHLDGSGL